MVDINNNSKHISKSPSLKSRSNRLLRLGEDKNLEKEDFPYYCDYQEEEILACSWYYMYEKKKVLNNII